MSAKEIKRKAMESGYSSCGIIPAAAFNEYEQYLDERIRAFPESAHHYERLRKMAKPPVAAKSIIVCIQPMNMYKVPDSLNGTVAKMYLFDGRLAYSHEYRAQKEFEKYLNTKGINILKCGVPDRWAAARAGIGKFGRNNFIYSPEYGSYVIVATWVVDKVLEYDNPPKDTIMRECNQGCLKCVRACPTNAMTDGFSMEMGKCVAHLTFSAKDIPDEVTRSQMGVWQYGCDVCQDVCPLNKGKFTENEDFPLLSEFLDYMKPENILAMDKDTYVNIVNPRFFYCGEEGLWLWKCNALRRMVNSGEAEYHRHIKDCLNHEDERLREIAEWGCKKLGI